MYKKKINNISFFEQQKNQKKKKNKKPKNKNKQTLIE